MEAARLHAGGQLLFGNSEEEPDPEESVSQALAAFGLYAVGEMQLQDEFWLWPENEECFYFWLALQTQWNSRDGWPSGLNYPAVQVVMEMRGIPRKQRPLFFSNIQAMEAACLQEWARKR